MTFRHTVDKLLERFRQYKPYVASLRAKLRGHEKLKECLAFFWFLDEVDEINNQAERRCLVQILRKKGQARQQGFLVRKFMGLSGLAAVIENLPKPLREALNGMYLTPILLSRALMQRLAH
jgi:hypothetical protein